MTALVSGGCIRLYPANHATPGPRWHIDEGHNTIGVIDTSTQTTIDSSGFLTFNLLGDPTERAVVSMTAASDETLTARGVSAGCSNGGPIVRIRFYADGTGPLDLGDPDHWAIIAGLYCNLWFTAVHDVPEPV